MLLPYVLRYLLLTSCLFVSSLLLLFLKWVFLVKGVLEIWSKYTEEHPCRSVISIKLLCNFIGIILRHECSPVNFLYIFRTPVPKKISGWLLRKWPNNNIKASFKSLLMKGVTSTAQKMKFSMKDFFSKCEQIRTADLVTFTEEILIRKLQFWRSVVWVPLMTQWIYESLQRHI